jgi:hypothetical protein
VIVGQDGRQLLLPDTISLDDFSTVCNQAHAQIRSGDKVQQMLSCRAEVRIDFISAGSDGPKRRRFAASIDCP